MQSPDVDVAIAGAGPAGAATALLAAARGLRVAIFDRARFPRDKPCGEGLMPSGVPVLRRLGVESQLNAAGMPVLAGIAFGLVGGEPHSVRFPIAGAERGLGVRRVRLDALLAERLAADSRIEFHEGTSAEGALPARGGLPALQTALGEVRARFVVGADGLHSSIRRRLGWTIGPQAPLRYGVVGHWRDDGVPDAWVRITVGEGMECYEAPVGRGERLVALLCRRDQAARFGGRLQDRYLELVRQLRPPLQGSSISGPVIAVGPFHYRARTVARQGIFLAGDAAGFVDPITGEGIAAGLRQAEALVSCFQARLPEAAYRLAHRRLTRDPRRVAALLVYLTGSIQRAARGMRGLERAPDAMVNLLGVNLGYWRFGRVRPRQWLALLAGR
jgi:flavin-dependent dehydrogenase